MKVLEEFPNYSVCKKGIIYNTKYDRVISQNKINSHLCVSLFKDNIKYTKRVDKLVFETFVEKLVYGNSIFHIDKNKTNNELSNLKQIKHFTKLHYRDPVSNNETGITGVYIKCYKYKSSICINYNTYTSYFSLTEKGLYKAIMFRVLKKIEFRLI